ncbi:MAG TPA: CsbD family protein [Vicinamibacterales bacterium]
MWNKDEVRGKSDQIKGRVKQGMGDLKNDERLRNEGVDDEAAGQVEESFGRGRRKVGEAISDLGKKIGR